MEKAQSRGVDTDPYYYCGFTCHVQEATFVVAAAGTALTMVLLLAMARLHFSVVYVVFVFIVFLSYAFILIAHYTNMPNLYWLHLVSNPICVGLIFAAFIYPALASLFGVSATPIPRDLTVLHLSRLIALTQLSASVFGALALAYCQSVVYRSFRWMRKRRIQVGVIVP